MWQPSLATALVVVDMQRYYLEPKAAFGRYHTQLDPACLDYIHKRCDRVVIPNTRRLLAAFREAGMPIIYLRLCGEADDRSDLHRHFREAHVRALRQGVPGLYPLRTDPFSEVAPALAPQPEDRVYCKTTYSAFTSTAIAEDLARAGIKDLVFTGLATSQCVETTARDAGDRGFGVIHVEDAQADYNETTHLASLHSSRGVCGGQLFSTESVLRRAPR